MPNRGPGTINNTDAYENLDVAHKKRRVFDQNRSINKCISSNANSLATFESNAKNRK